MATNREIKKVGENYFLFENSLPVLKLNEVGAFIYQLHMDLKTEEEIAKALSSEYDVEYEEALNDVLDFIESIPNGY